MPENIKKELDNFIYAGAALALAVVVMFFDLKTGLTMASALAGALLVKVKTA